MSTTTTTIANDAAPFISTPDVQDKPTTITMRIPSPSQPPPLRAASVLSLLEYHAQGGYIGESVSQLEHSLQCAHLALQTQASDSTVVAALFHDIGQFVPLSIIREAINSPNRLQREARDDAGANEILEEETEVGRPNHALLGSRYLEALGFPDSVCTIVASHVDAKRYLCAVDPGYHDGLSEASTASLRQQGGPMGEEERREFERRGGGEEWKECVRVRRWDDMAKVVGIVESTPRIWEYRDMVEEVLLLGENYLCVHDDR